VAPISEYLEELATSRALPDVAVGMCMSRLPESAPALRAVLERAADGEELTENEERLLFRGLFILGGGRDPQAFKPLLRLLRPPLDEVDRLLGDTNTESLLRLAAGIFDGDHAALFEAIADLRIDDFTRHSLLGAATFLAWEGRIDRDVMRIFLRKFHDESLAPDGDAAWDAWQLAGALLGFGEFAPLVEAAWRSGRITRDMSEPEDFQSDLEKALKAPGDIERFEEFGLGYIEDVLEALERYSDFAEEDELDDLLLESGPWEPARPVVNPWRHVGRNDPCPCGSGKKAKRCCLPR
jgi:hypothetical protein